jgi:hypothetical protein
MLDIVMIIFGLEEKMLKILTIIVVILLISLSLYIFIKRQDNSIDIEYSMITADFDKMTGKVTQNDSSNKLNYLGMLQFKSMPNSKNMASAIVCAEQVSNIDKVDLYMPDMGHGSQPPIVLNGDIPSKLKSRASEEIGFGCLNLSGLQLFMPGNWQLRVFYQNGKVGLFNINISE